MALIKDLPNAIWHVDRGFLFNLVQLFKRPGYAIQDYLKGKRKNFYHPLSYMLVVLAAMLIAMNLMRVHYYDPVQDAGMDPERAAFWKEYDGTQQAWIRLYKYFIPFYFPWMALAIFLWLRLMKQRYSYWESVVITCFVSAQMTVPQIFVLTLAFLVNDTTFTRASDMVVNNGVIATLFFFQFYQLGSPRLRKAWRIVLAILGALMLIGFAYSAVYLFYAFATRFEL